MKKKWAVPTNQPGFDNFCFLFFLSRLQMLGSVSIQLGFCSGETYITYPYITYLFITWIVFSVVS